MNKIEKPKIMSGRFFISIIVGFIVANLFESYMNVAWGNTSKYVHYVALFLGGGSYAVMYYMVLKPRKRKEEQRRINK